MTYKNADKILLFTAFIMAPLIILLMAMDIALYINFSKSSDPQYSLSSLRNSAEFLSFCANVSVPAVAIWALRFARKQSTEAEHSRLAMVYMEITERWGDTKLIEARRLFQKAVKQYNDNPNVDLVGQPIVGQTFTTCSSYIKHCFLQMYKDNRDVLRQYVHIITFLEDLGVLCRKDYIKKETIFDFIGGTIIYLVELSFDYLKWARTKGAADGKADEAVYANLLWLYKQAKEFEKSEMYKESHDDINPEEGI